MRDERKISFTGTLIYSQVNRADWDDRLTKFVLSDGLPDIGRALQIVCDKLMVGADLLGWALGGRSR